jgi:hypothetical protein
MATDDYITSDTEEQDKGVKLSWETKMWLYHI